NAEFVLGSDLKEFEKEFAGFCESQYSVGVSSGMDALIIALKALGMGPGDEVITVPNTFIATVEAISHAGAKPVFVDASEEDYNIDPALIENKITGKTRAIIPVHLFGQPADMDKIMDIARKNGLFVIEDACQAHGARYGGRRVGTFGEIGAFSFYPGKNLGAYGDGGAVVTSNKELYEKMRILRSHGESGKNRHDIIGATNRLDNLQAAVLRVKLKYLDKWNSMRAGNAAIYREYLRSLDVIVPREISGRQHVYHLFVIRVKDRGKVTKALSERGVAFGIHYPKPVHLQEAYKFLGHSKGDFPVSEMLADEIISLPMFPELTEKQIKYVCDSIRYALE
ncbi:MAG: DegT/DnrJ/EryC1/StrS family aminotransferase, partial [Actinobacteria bacterium]|nr:DegT/DnrJ/EryC1/StrS family aminotransferase [Actinomycetota bacterium]